LLRALTYKRLLAVLSNTLMRMRCYARHAQPMWRYAMRSLPLYLTRVAQMGASTARSLRRERLPTLQC
jgi:hypothetical protein